MRLGKEAEPASDGSEVSPSPSKRRVPFLPSHPEQSTPSGAPFQSLAGCSPSSPSRIAPPPAVCGKPAGRTWDSLERPAAAHGREIIAQPMSHGLHLFDAAGSGANGVGQNAIQVDAVGKPLGSDWASSDERQVIFHTV